MKTLKYNHNAALLFIVLITLLGTSYLLLYNTLSNNYNAKAALPIGEITQVNVSKTNDGGAPATAISEDGSSITVWAMSGINLADPTAKGVYYRRFDHNGNPLDSKGVLVNKSISGSQNTPQVAMDAKGNFIIVWTGPNNDPNPNQDIFLQAFQNNQGVITPIGEQIIVNSTTTGNQNQPAISIASNTTKKAIPFVVSWTNNNQNNEDIYWQRFEVDFSQNRTPLRRGQETIANSFTPNNQATSDVAINNFGEFMVTWMGDNGSGNRIMYQIYNATGNPIGKNTEASITAPFPSPKAATNQARYQDLNEGSERTFIITYSALFNERDNIGARTIHCIPESSSNLNCNLNPVEIIANTQAEGFQSNPDVAADYLGNFTIVWQDSPATTSDMIYAQSYNAQGVRIGQNFTINTNTQEDHIQPSIAIAVDGRFNVAFKNKTNTSYHFQKYSSSLFKIQNETLAHPSNNTNQANAATAIAPNGNHVQTWTNYNDGTIRMTLSEFNPSTPAELTKIKENVIISNSNNSNNSSVSFFQDTTGNNVGAFIVAWEDVSTGDKDIYYQIFNATGNAETAPIRVTNKKNNQAYPTVTAGYYEPQRQFAIGWIDETTNTIEGAFHENELSFYQLGSCQDCANIEVSLNPVNQNTVYAWQSTINNQEGDSENTQSAIFIAQATGPILIGAPFQASSNTLASGDPSIGFLNNNHYLVTYTELTGSSSTVYGTAYEFGANGPSNPGTQFNLTQAPSTSNTEFASKVSSDINNQQFIAVWADAPTNNPSKDNIFGQYFFFDEEKSTRVSRFGPTFHINTTSEGNQTLPAVSLNQTGQTIVAWEGTSLASNDESGEEELINNTSINIQQLQNPQITESSQTISPTAQQEILSGGQFLEVPTSIAFPDVTLSATDQTTQSISIRDANFGGDLKYIEVQDATGADFTLTIQVNDFIASADGKAYIKSDQHFRVRNWDGAAVQIDNEGACQQDPDACYNTITSTQYPISPTAFSLSPVTRDFVFANNQQVLAEKTGTVNKEIGRWRIYPEFEITIPPVIPPGEHKATIIFTLT